MIGIKGIDLNIDDYHNQKFMNEKENIVSLILNILYARPGTFPNLPHIGMDIASYLYKVEGSIDTEHIKNQLTNQCKELLPYLIRSDIAITFVEDAGEQILLIKIPVIFEGEDQDLLIMAANNKSKIDDIKHVYTFEKAE